MTWQSKMFVQNFIYNSKKSAKSTHHLPMLREVIWDLAMLFGAHKNVISVT